MVGCTMAALVVIDDTRSRKLGIRYIPTLAVEIARDDERNLELTLRARHGDGDGDGDDHEEVMVDVRLFRDRRIDLWPT